MNDEKQISHSTITSQNSGNGNGSVSSSTRIIAVGGGKGGAGKSLVSLALGLSLSGQKKKVILVDADFSSPSLNHLFSNNLNGSAFFQSHFQKVEFPLHRTDCQNLILLSGYSGILGITEYLDKQQHAFLKKIMQINADYVILDLGSGYSQLSIQLFNAADEMLVIVNPDPMSILETFGFIKTCQYQLFKDSFKNQPRIMNYVDDAFKNYDFKKFRLLRRITKQYGREHSLRPLKPKLILNMLRQNSEMLDIQALQIACEELLGVQVEHISDIHFNESIRTYVRNSQLWNVIDIPDFQNLTEKVLSNTNSPLRNFKLPDLESLKHKDVICSCRCSLWENCSYQRGGYPCRIKYIGFINTHV